MKGIKVVIQDCYVKISYTNNYSRKRFPTGVRLNPGDQISDNGKLKGYIQDKEKKQSTIDQLKLKIESAVQEFYNEYGIYPSSDELNNHLKENSQNKKKIKSERLLDAYYLFYNETIDEFTKSDTKSIQSLNSHKALKYYLEDFEIYQEKPIFFYEINKKWMFDFKKFNENKRESTDSKKYQTFGGLRGNTIRKKIGVFLNFIKWASEKKYCKLPIDILDFKKEIAMPTVIKATITKSELFELMKLDIKNTKTQFIRDLFVFACWTGMRWSDLISIDKKQIKQTQQGTAIIKKSQKTKGKFTAYLTEYCEQILSRYEYNFNRITNPAYNRELHKFLKSTALFDDSTEFEDDGRYLDRWEVISIHRGRDSFVTILLGENIPHNTIMQYTGHKHLSTLEGYIDKNTKVLNFINQIKNNGKT
jgi:integrase